MWPFTSGNKAFSSETDAKIFDPIGFPTPFTVEMKILFQILFQEACTKSTGKAI